MFVVLDIQSRERFAAAANTTVTLDRALSALRNPPPDNGLPYDVVEIDKKKICYEKCPPGLVGADGACLKGCDPGDGLVSVLGFTGCVRQCTKNFRSMDNGCYRNCPDGYRDDGKSCMRDLHIYGKGCCTIGSYCRGICPSGYTDDGCTCRRAPSLIWKDYYKPESYQIQGWSRKTLRCPWSWDEDTVPDDPIVRNRKKGEQCKHHYECASAKCYASILDLMRDAEGGKHQATKYCE
jgi:hypothetical protein